MSLNRLRIACVVLVVVLIVLGVSWELWLAPIRPGGSWLVLKVVPLLFALRGLLAGKRYTYQWVSLLVWLYFTEGIVRATSDQGLGTSLGWIEFVTSTALFACVAAYSRLSAPSRQIHNQEKGGHAGPP